VYKLIIIITMNSMCHLLGTTIQTYSHSSINFNLFFVFNPIIIIIIITDSKE